MDLMGRRFGKRVVIAHTPNQGKEHKPFWRVRCDCGREDEVRAQTLRSGVADQCRDCCSRAVGKISFRHGHSRLGKLSPEYISWQSMRTRCLNPKEKRWYLYGGRGIKICDRWLLVDGVGFKNFLEDMGPRPEGKTLDRFPNVNGNYEPNNCRWATPKEQAGNQRKHGLIGIFTNEELLAELHRRGIK